MQGSSHVDESISSQKSSSSVHAKEALIEIDYSNLHEDLKVFRKLTHTKKSKSTMQFPCQILYFYTWKPHRNQSSSFWTGRFVCGRDQDWNEHFAAEAERAAEHPPAYQCSQHEGHGETGERQGQVPGD